MDKADLEPQRKRLRRGERLVQQIEDVTEEINQLAQARRIQIKTWCDHGEDAATPVTIDSTDEDWGLFRADLLSVMEAWLKRLEAEFAEL